MTVTSWHSKALGDGVEAAAPSRQIQEMYQALAFSTRLALDCAVFSEYDLRANMITVYFSPSAWQLSEAVNATPCDKPTNRPGFALLVGDQRAWKALFGQE